MKLTNKVRIISFYLALILVAIGIYIDTNNKAEQYKLQIKHTYSSALETLSTNISNIENALKKSVYVSSPGQFTDLAVQLCSQSTSAKMVIANLPASSDELVNVNKFLSQVGEYSLSLSKKAAEGKPIDQDDRQNLSSLSDVAGKLHSSINDIYTVYSSFDAMDSQIDGPGQGNAFYEDMGTVEQNFSDYPTLIYDGPFSDHISDSNSQLLEKAEPVLTDTAKIKAAEALGKEVGDLKEGEVYAGDMPSYSFSSDENDFVAVTKNGGYVAYMRKIAPQGDNGYDFEHCLKKAEGYLKELGYKNMQSNYYFINEGVCIINFAYVNGVTVCYTDLIKVGVDMSNLNVVMLDAKGYISNHKSRNILTPKHSPEAAVEVLSDNLEPLSVSQALIPTSAKGEVHCYEIKCTGINSEEILMYINTENLTEERILILLKTDGGVLTK